jgi:PadR family transcriptional regulator PadR
VQDESPHPRKYYRLTKAGRSALGAMQAEWRRFAGKIDRLLAAAQKESSEHDGP